MSKRRRRNKNKLRNEEQSMTEEEEVSIKKVEEEKVCKKQMARQVKSEVYEENEENISNLTDDCEIAKKSKRRRRKVNTSRSALLIRSDLNGTNQSLFQNDIEQEMHEKEAAALRRKPSEIYNQTCTGKIQSNQFLGSYNKSQDKTEKNNEISSEIPITNSDELELSPILKVPSINNITGYPNSSDSVNLVNNVEVQKTYADKLKESSVKIKEESKLVFILRGVDDSKQSFEISMEDQKKCKKSKSKTKQFKPISPPILESNCESNEDGNLFSMENLVQKNTKRASKNVEPILATSKVENNEPDDKKIPAKDVRENDDPLQHAERDKNVKKRRVKHVSVPDNQIIYSNSKSLGTNIGDNTISAPKVGKEITFKIVGKESDEFDGNINQDDESLLKKPSENNTQQDDSRNKKSKSKKKKRNVSQIETPEVSPVNEGTVNNETIFQSSSEELTGKSEVDYIVPVDSSSSVSQNSSINEEAVSRHSESIKTPKNVDKDERKRGKLKKDKHVKNEIESKKIKMQNSDKNPIPLRDNNQPTCLFTEAAVSTQNYQNSVSSKRDSIIPASGQCETTKYGNSSKTVHNLNSLEIPKYDLFAISEAEKRFAKLLEKEHNNNDSSKVVARESDKFTNSQHSDSLEIPKYDLFAISEAEKRFAKLLDKEHNNNSCNVLATESDKFSNFNPHLDSLGIPKYDLFAIYDAEKRFAKLLESVHNASRNNNNCYNVLTTESDNDSTNDNYTKTTDELHVNCSGDEFGEIPDGTSKIVNPDLQTIFSESFSSRPTTASSCDEKSSAQKMCSWSQVAAKEAKTKTDDSQDHASENQHKNKQQSLEFSKTVRIKVCDRVASRVNISLAEDSEGFVKYVSKREMRKQRSRTSSRSDDEDLSRAVESIQNETLNNIANKSDTEEGTISDSNGSDSIEPSEANTDRITLDSVWINENSERKENYSVRPSEGIETSASDTDDNSGSRINETCRQRKKSKSIIFEPTVIVHTNTSSHSMGIDIKPPSLLSDTSASDTDDNCGSRSSSESRSTSSRKRRKSRGKKRTLDDGSCGGTDLRARPGSTCILDGQPMHLDSKDGAAALGESNNTIPEDNTDKIEDNKSPEESDDTICNQKPNSPRIKELFVMIFMELYLLLIYYATGLGKKKPE
ncbi:uncharacterized protein LOC111052404 [Nilaparvata lugens]|uniref:uncharacterized protein LOC111052404 n=1 Tax=Nilaparvata lugens TaxID=108931 RepID=UPI00193C95BA|nr:uncharacterized protein LOC111052404 [Nilaparvata lugens]